MCTILLKDETKDARKMSVREAQQCVDLLMEYDKQLAEPFSRDDLKKLLDHEWLEKDSRIFTDGEKQLLKELGWKERTDVRETHTSSIYHDQPLDAEEIENARRYLKAQVIGTPDFSGTRLRIIYPGMWDKTGQIRVWLDGCNYCESKYKGFYYVRYRPSMLIGLSTAYASPDLVVEKKKLRPDQVEYMERKRQETFDAAKRLDGQKEQ